jgi:hypothetical protein
MAARIGLVLNIVGLPPVEGQRGARGGPHRSIVDCCLMVWTNFRDFIRSMAHGTTVMSWPMPELITPRSLQSDSKWTSTRYK